MKVVTGNQGKNKRKAVGHPGDVPIVYIASPTGQMSIYVSVGVAVPPVPPVPPVPHNGTGLGAKGSLQRAVTAQTADRKKG